MDKFVFGNYKDTGDLAYASTKGYVNPTSEIERRKQLSSPLGQLRDYVNSTVTVDDSNNVVQLKVSPNGVQYRTDSSASYSSVAFSFVGMVVSGDEEHFGTEAKVKAIFGSDTSWTKISEVFVTSANVVGNGNSLALTSGGSTLRGLRYSTSTVSHLIPSNDAYGVELPATGGGSGSGDVSNSSAIGVPTKTQLGEHPEYSGLIVDTETVYSWKRTA